MRRLRRRYGRARAYLESIRVRGFTIVVHYVGPGVYESEIVGYPSVYRSHTRAGAIAVAKRVVEAMRGD
jgi:hypothetical protein